MVLNRSITVCMMIVGLWVGSCVGQNSVALQAAPDVQREATVSIERLLASAPTQTICAGTAPSGWVTTAIKGTCSLGPGTTATQRTITNVTSLPTSSKVNICAPFTPYPAGWVMTAINTSPCFQYLGTTYMSGTILNIAGLPVSYKVNVCAPFDTFPSGWVLVAISPTPCNQLLGTTYTAGTLMNIAGLPSNTLLDVCGATIPSGWVEVKQETLPCSTGPISYLKYQIRKL